MPVMGLTRNRINTAIAIEKSISNTGAASTPLNADKADGNSQSGLVNAEDGSPAL